jgi:hypothetical protein
VRLSPNATSVIGRASSAIGDLAAHGTMKLKRPKTTAQTLAALSAVLAFIFRPHLSRTSMAVEVKPQKRRHKTQAAKFILSSEAGMQD